MIPLDIRDWLSIFQNACFLKKLIFLFGTGDMLGKNISHGSLLILQSILQLLFDMSNFYNSYMTNLQSS